MNSTHKQKVRLNARRNFYKQELQKRKEKLNSLQKTSLESELKSKNIPKN